MECSHDCFNCPYDDCVNDVVTRAEMLESAQRDRVAAIMGGADVDQERYAKLSARIRAHKYYEANRERILAKQKAYYQANKEYYREYAKQYAKEHPEAKNAASKRYNEAHKEEIIAYKKAYREKNADKILKKQREYREKTAKRKNEMARKCDFDCFNCKFADCIAGQHTPRNGAEPKPRPRYDTEKYREYQKQWYSNNREKVKEYQKKYYRENRERLLEYSKERYRKGKAAANAE